MSHFYFPAHDVVLLHGAFDDKLDVTVTNHNHPINLDLVVSFDPDAERYDFGSCEANRNPSYGAVPVIRFRLMGRTHFWFFSDEPSRDAELRALNNHLVNRGAEP